MNSKKIMIFWLVIIGVFLVIGVNVRGRFTDIFADNGKAGGLDKVKVAQFNTGYEELLSSVIEEEIDNSKTVLIVRATGDIRFVCGNALQDVVVEQVLANEMGYELNVGDEIKLIGQGRVSWEDMAMEMGFVNFMSKDKEYLVFVGQEIHAKRETDGAVYELNDRIITFRQICLEDGENICVPGEVYVNYSRVSENEFFAEDEETVEMMKEFKEHILKKYGVVQ